MQNTIVKHIALLATILYTSVTYASLPEDESYKKRIPTKPLIPESDFCLTHKINQLETNRGFPRGEGLVLICHFDPGTMLAERRSQGISVSLRVNVKEKSSHLETVSKNCEDEHKISRAIESTTNTLLNIASIISKLTEAAEIYASQVKHTTPARQLKNSSCNDELPGKK